MQCVYYNIFSGNIIVIKSKPNTNMSAENDKYFLALLNGLARMHYYDDSTISIEMLKEELYSDASDVEFNAMFQKCSLIIKVSRRHSSVKI